MPKYLCIAIGLAAAMIATNAASAQGTDATTPCGAGPAPIISAGLPDGSCTRAGNVIIHRGPAIVPEPTLQRRVYDPVGDAALRTYTVVPSVQRTQPYYVPYRIRRRSPSFGLVVKTDNVFFRVGSGGHRGHGFRPRRPGRPHHNRPGKPKGPNGIYARAPE